MNIKNELIAFCICVNQSKDDPKFDLDRYADEYVDRNLKGESIRLEDVKTITDIKEGDTLIITGDTLKNEPVKVQKVKVTPQDGTEIIFDKKMNRFFNLGMYLKGQSWVKEMKIVCS